MVFIFIQYFSFDIDLKNLKKTVQNHPFLP
jgi:hypothetical protein